MGAGAEIGLPAGVEFALIAVYLFVVYTVSRPFGAAAQAGFGIGQRIIQAGFMPIVALGFAVAPVAGQNFGAHKAERVRETFKRAALMAAGIMALFTFACLFADEADDPILLVRSRASSQSAPNICASSRGAARVGSHLRERQHVSGDGQYDSAAHRVLHADSGGRDSGDSAFTDAGFELRWIWYLSVGATMLQLAMNLMLLEAGISTQARVLRSGTLQKFPAVFRAHCAGIGTAPHKYRTSLFTIRYGTASSAVCGSRVAYLGAPLFTRMEAAVNFKNLVVFVSLIATGLSAGACGIFVAVGADADCPGPQLSTTITNGATINGAITGAALSALSSERRRFRVAERSRASW